MMIAAMTKPNGRPHGGARPGAGRKPKKGSKSQGPTGRPPGRPPGSRSTVYKHHVAALLAISGPTPKEVLVQVMRWHLRARRYDEAARLAAMAAPYVHPRLSSSAIVMQQKPKDMTSEELQAFIEEAERNAGVSDEEVLALVKAKGNA